MAEMLRDVFRNENCAVRRVTGAGLVAIAIIGFPAACGLADESVPTASTGISAGPFAADRPDVAFMGPTDALLLVIQPDELSRRPELAPAVKALDALLESPFKATTLVDGASVPPIRLADLDYIAYVMRPEAVWQPASPAVAGGDANTPTPMMGCDVAVRFVVATDVQTWAAKNVRDMQTIQDGDFSYLQGPGDPGERMHLAQCDPHTFIMSNSAERLRQLATGPGLAEAEGAADFADQWASVDGGLATLALAPGVAGSPADFDGGVGPAFGQLVMALLPVAAEPGQPNPVEEAARTIGDGVRRVCVGVDIDATSVLSVRVAAACTNYDAAKKVRESLSFFQTFAKSYLQAVQGAVAGQAPDPMTQMSFDAFFLAGTMFGDAATDFRLRERNEVDVWLEASGELPPSIRDGLARADITFDLRVQPVAAEEAPAASRVR